MTSKSPLKRSVKTAPTAVKKKTTTKKVAKAPAVNVHLAAGMSTAKYVGPSSFVNNNRKPQIKIADARPLGRMTDRMNAGFYALRNSYKTKAFQPRGFDNGVLRDLLASGLIAAHGGTVMDIDGAKYLVDAAKPVTFALTKAGMSYGKA